MKDKAFHKIVLFFVLLASACDGDPYADYKEAIKSGRNTIPWVAEVEGIFAIDNIDHFITHYAFDRHSPVEWQTKIYFLDRYVMQISQDIRVDYSNNRVREVLGEMQVTINEVVAFDAGRRSAKYG